MTRDEILERIRWALEEVLLNDIDPLKPEDDFCEIILRLDHPRWLMEDFAGLVMEMENAFSVIITDEEAETFKHNVGLAADLIAAKLEENHLSKGEKVFIGIGIAILILAAAALIALA